MPAIDRSLSDCRYKKELSGVFKDANITYKSTLYYTADGEAKKNELESM